ncbi:MAG: CRISPR-associated endonuclease Cas1 [Gallionella sp.]|nr:CRISPR-associated endonuclease Cas1 [Gallionella sp.]
MSLLNFATSDDALTYAWLRVKENGGGAGSDGVGLDRFSVGLLARLGKLRAQVMGGSYLPDPLLRIVLPRAGKSPRLLAVPTVRDRVLQTAVAQVINPILDATFEEESFAYRPGRSVRDAVAAVIEARDDGFTFVVDADIEAFFDNIPHDDLVAKLIAVLPDTTLMPLIRAWLGTPVKTSSGFVKSVSGVPQGSPLSPLLSNLYLDAFDETVTNSDTRRLVRYADDFVILTEDIHEAELALEGAKLWLAGAGLAINFDKTRLTTFDLGFTFLGVRFEGNEQWAEDDTAEIWLLPPQYQKHASRKPKRAQPVKRKPVRQGIRANSIAAPDELGAVAGRVHFDEAPAPLLRTLYLGEPGVYLRQDGGRILVVKEGEEMLSVPIEKIDQVIIANEGAVSFGAMRALLARDANLLLQGWAGEPHGVVVRANDTRINLRVKQYQRVGDASFTLAVACAIVAGKIANARLLLRRYYRFRPGGESPVDHSLCDLQSKSSAASDVEVLRGLEGAAARQYFGAFRDLLPESWKAQFGNRTQQPPLDAVNALLSYGYAVLYQNVLTLVTARGLEIHLGHLHALRDGHPSLVSDLVEEFRSLVVDAVVLKLALDHAYDASEFTFEPSESGGKLSQFCRIEKSLRHKFIERLEAKLQSTVTHPMTHEVGDYRRMIRMQVALYVQALEGVIPVYRSFVLR